MGKLKSLWIDWEQEEQHSAQEEAFYEYCLEQTIKQKQWEDFKSGKETYQLKPGKEEDSYNAYMEGKLCGDNTNTAHTDTSTNLSDGRTIFGLRTKRNMPK